MSFNPLSGKFQLTISNRSIC